MLVKAPKMYIGLYLASVCVLSCSAVLGLGGTSGSTVGGTVERALAKGVAGARHVIGPRVECGITGRTVRADELAMRRPVRNVVMVTVGYWSKVGRGRSIQVEVRAGGGGRRWTVPFHSAVRICIRSIWTYGRRQPVRVSTQADPPVQDAPVLGAARCLAVVGGMLTRHSPTQMTRAEIREPTFNCLSTLRLSSRLSSRPQHVHGHTSAASSRHGWPFITLSLRSERF